MGLKELLRRDDKQPMTTNSKAPRGPKGAEPRDPARPHDESLTSVTFYWELSEADYEIEAASEFAQYEEGALAHDLDHGRRLLNVPWRPITDWPMPIPQPDIDPDHEQDVYEDAISAILQVAVYHGYDPETLCVRAQEAQERLRDMSTKAAWCRQHRTH